MVRNLVSRILALALLWATSATAQDAGALVESVHTIPTRPGVTQLFVQTKVANPVATLILYPGSTGAIGIFPNGSAKLDTMMIVASRRLLANQGFNLLLLDAPSDRATKGVWEYQRTPEYMEHNAAVLDYARKLSDVPVFFLGAGAGSIAAAGVATNLAKAGRPLPDGMIYLSGWLVPKAKWPIPNFVFNAEFAMADWPEMAGLKLPTLIVSHEQDNCGFSEFAHATAFQEKLKATVPVELAAFKGGAVPSGNACYPGGYNNFNGLDGAVMAAVGDWVRKTVAGMKK